MRFVPKSVPPNPLSIKRLAELVGASKQTLALTGAGMSTESGLPDYRSEGVGLYARTDRRPMEYQTFLRSEISRKFYWARNFIAWPYFSQVEPNGGHYLLSQWALNNRLFGIITQNVDRLHHRAGPGRILELHGCSHRVICLKCGHKSERSELQKRFLELNPSWSKYDATKKELAIAPDGDVELPPDVVQHFKTFSSFRLLLQASQLRIPIVIVNIGPTRADNMAGLIINSRIFTTLEQVDQLIDN
ncbi:hypothetical protein P879_04044 [Paragonimus westermani]|uniref:Deacetylase sirtuin-type domain-containing protein n=1 Tax=Paragonimus westermani TaxID=34504 RepID=A0A8T0DSG1_9TREM|nr:hypothetical protein P879_04044 [Paragonimus westermani]